MPQNIQQNLYPFLYLFITDICQIPQLQTFSEYEKQEDGYAIPYLEAYRYAFSQPKNLPIQPKLFKEVNAISTQHLPQSQNREFRHDCGNFNVSCEILNDERNQSKSIVSSYSMTKKGIQEFIEYWFLNQTTQKFHAISFERKPEFPKETNCMVAFHPNFQELMWLEMQPSGRNTATPFDMSIHLPQMQMMAESYAYTICIDIMPNVDNPRLETENQMEVLTRNYHLEIGSARSKHEKLVAIARYIQHVEQLHPFMDGNIRTCSIILNKLLRDNGFPLSILYNPNMLDCCDLDTVIRMIKEGQKVYIQMLTHNNPEEILLDASLTPWNNKMSYIRCEACHDISEELLEGFAQDVLAIPKTNETRIGLFAPSKQTLANKFILEIFPLLATNHSGKCGDIRESLAYCQFGIALRRACAFGEYGIVNKILDISDELEIDLKECSSNGKNALAWLESSTNNSEDKEALINRLNQLMNDQNPHLNNS